MAGSASGVDLDVDRAQARARGRRARAAGSRSTASWRERLQHEHLRPRQQRRVDLERRVLGGGADQHDVAGLDARQERVLLRLVEAVDLVHEDDGAAPGAAPAVLGRGHHLLISLMPASTALNGTKRDWVRSAMTPRQRGLAGAGRAPQDDATAGRRARWRAAAACRARGCAPGRRCRRACAGACARRAACRRRRSRRVPCAGLSSSGGRRRAVAHVRCRRAA